MTRAQLHAAGRRLFGPDWKSPLARAAGYTYRHFLRILQDDAPIDLTMEMAVVGIEAVRSGFVPSWGAVAVEQRAAPKARGTRKRRRMVAEQVRP